MYRVPFCALLVALVAVSTAAAQEPSPLGAPVAPRIRATEKQPIALGEVHPNLTPEMWIYLNEQKRHDNARLAVRRKAEFRTAQRNRRLATQKWFGFSNQRPQAAVTPFTSHYSPTWSGNGVHGYDWRGTGSRTVIIGYPAVIR